MVFASPSGRETSPIVFEKIGTLPFEDAHVRQASSDTTKSYIPHSVAPEIVVQETSSVGLVLPGISEIRSKPLGNGSPTPENGSVYGTPPSSYLSEPARLMPSSGHGQLSQTGPIDDSIRQRYSMYNPSVRSSVISGGTSEDVMGRLEDYGDIEIDKIDRYGFFPQTIQRRLSSSSLEAARARTQSLRRKNTVTRDKIKRASMNLGITPIKDYLETPRQESFSPEKEAERSQKWRNMALRKGPMEPFVFKVNAKLVTRVYKGIPDCWRSPAWHSFVSMRASVSHRELLQLYQQHSETPCEHDGQIDLDVPRTISGHVLFRRRHEGGQRLLFRVLHAITLQFPETGYVQGMASVAATLLCYFPEDEAFVMLARLWTNRNLMALYEPGFPDLIKAFDALEEQMKTTQVGRHLLRIGCQPMAWATRWYLTLFHISLPFRTQLRVWDLFMLYNPKTVHDRFKVLEITTLALIEGIDAILLGSEFEQAMSILTSPLEVKDDDRLMDAIRRKFRSVKW